MDVHHMGAHVVQPPGDVEQRRRAYSELIPERHRDRSTPAHVYRTVEFVPTSSVCTGAQQRDRMATGREPVAEIPNECCRATDPRVVEIGDDTYSHPAAMTTPSEVSELKERFRSRSMRR